MRKASGRLGPWPWAYRVILAADANAARTDAEHNATLHTVYRSFGDVRPTSEILALIARG